MMKVLQWLLTEKRIGNQYFAIVVFYSIMITLLAAQDLSQYDESSFHRLLETHNAGGTFTFWKKKSDVKK